MKKSILAMALALGLSTAAAGNDWTIHTVSVHVGVEDLNNLNPGIGYNVTDDIRVGAFYNSYKLPSVYAAKLIPLHPRVRLGLGAITGYKLVSPDEGLIVGKATGVVPLLAIEADITDNVSVIWFGRALNLEVRF